MKPYESQKDLASQNQIGDAMQENAQQAIIEELKTKNEDLKREIEYCQERIASLERKNYRLKSDNKQLTDSYDKVLHSSSWRITKPFRAIVGWVKRVFHSTRVTALFLKGLRSLKKNGLRATFFKARRLLSQQNSAKEYVKRNTPNEEELARERATVFPRKVTFSILVPLYNTPLNFLKEMIESVVNQSYPNWELCLADGSDAAHEEVGKLAQEYAAQDGRIRYQKLEKNEGIAGNTNACVRMATGDYIALFDHDDLLHPSVLFEDMKAIIEQDADFIYTDEMTFIGDISNPITIHFKPDFAIDNLRANNYICHFSVFSRRLLDEAGWFSSEYDGSQDFDIILRLTEKAKHIVHIPRVLYYWRNHPGSVASDISAKPYCITSAIKAINAHLKRVGLPGSAREAKKLTSVYKVDYELKGQPFISIIIPNRDRVDDLSRCIFTICEKSSYHNFEIIVVENGSKKKETQEYYKILASKAQVRVVTWDKPYQAAAVNNFGASFATGEYLLFLHSDIQAINADWIEELLMYAQREDVGAVGGKLYYPDNTIQSAGLVVGMNHTVGPVHYRQSKDNVGYMGKLWYAQDMSAVSGACMMVRKSCFEDLGGFDEQYEKDYYDADYCLRAGKEGKLVVFTPFAQLYHFEPKRYEGELKRRDGKAEPNKDAKLFCQRWRDFMDKGDPYYNPNFSLERSDYAIR